MLKKFAVILCLVSLAPAAAGAQDVALLVNQQPAPQAAQAPQTVNLMPREDRSTTLLAANDVQGNQSASDERPKKSHAGLSFKEFCDVHFGEYRWVYWVGAVAAIVAIHVVAAD